MKIKLVDIMKYDSIIRHRVILLFNIETHYQQCYAQNYMLHLKAIIDKKEWNYDDLFVMCGKYNHIETLIVHIKYEQFIKLYNKINKLKTFL